VTASDAAIAAEVEPVCRRYIRDFPAAVWRYLEDGTPIDHAAIDFWISPTLYVMGDGKGSSSVSIFDQALISRQLCALYEQYRAQGWAGDLRIDSIKVSVVSAEIALVEMVGTRVRPDGSEFNNWNSCYWMKRTTSGWKQFAVTETLPPCPPVAEWVRWLRASGGI
jgi:hypothetical protein